MSLKPEHIIQLNQKDYVTFKGLLALAHDKGLDSTETVIEQIPDAANQHTAIVRATVTFRDEEGKLRAFTCVGDASPATTKINAYLRMAETRALGRCFRVGLNIGETMAEELSDDDAPPSRGGETSSHNRPLGPSDARGVPGGQGPAHDGGGEGMFCSYEGCGIALTPNQAKLSLASFNALLCPDHQRVMKKAAA